MRIEQYVMAYGVEQDRLRAILPDGYSSLRPVLRFNAEIRDHHKGYIELNTAVEKDGIRGWLNVAYWDDVPFERNENTVTFKTDFLALTFTGTGMKGSCPAEKDNAGCYFIGEAEELRSPETIMANKEYCICSFQWTFTEADAHGVSTGKTLPAYPSAAVKVYPKESFSAENAAKIPCDEVLGSYVVIFDR